VKAVELGEMRLAPESTEKRHDFRAVIADTEFLKTSEEAKSLRKLLGCLVVALECGPRNVDVSGSRSAYNLPPRWSPLDVLLAIDSPEACQSRFARFAINDSSGYFSTDAVISSDRKKRDEKQ
jgi:hypothetical protein